LAHTVLLVDDDPLVLETVADMLADQGCEVVTATDGTEALAKLKAQPWIDVLITDITMPGLGGYELAEAAKRVKPDLPVTLLSGRETDRRGFPLIRKPFRENELTRIMSRTAGLC